MSQNVRVRDHVAAAKRVEPADHYILQSVHENHPLKWEKLASVRLQMYTLIRYATMTQPMMFSELNMNMLPYTGTLNGNNHEISRPLWNRRFITLFTTAHH
jgi:hypothetical protein